MEATVLDCSLDHRAINCEGGGSWVSLSANEVTMHSVHSRRFIKRGEMGLVKRLIPAFFISRLLERCCEWFGVQWGPSSEKHNSLPNDIHSQWLVQGRKRKSHPAGANGWHLPPTPSLWKSQGPSNKKFTVIEVSVDMKCPLFRVSVRTHKQLSVIQANFYLKSLGNLW